MGFGTEDDFTFKYLSAEKTETDPCRGRSNMFVEKWKRITSYLWISMLVQESPLLCKYFFKVGIKATGVENCVHMSNI